MKDDKKNVKSSKKNLSIIIAVYVAVVLVTFKFSTIVGFFILITTLVAVALVFLAKKFFGLNLNDDDKINSIPYVNQDADLSDIKSILNIPLPFAVVDEKGLVVLYNNYFRDLFEDETIGKSFETLIGAFDCHINKQKTKINEIPYDVFCTKVVDTEQQREVLTVCLVNTGESEAYAKRLDEDKTVIGLIYIDNFEELSESADDTQIPLLTALIDRKINSYISGFGGVVKKFEKDRFIFMISNGALNLAKEKKFEIINAVKETKVGDHIPVTLSIGIGVDNKGLDLAMKNAREAIDLALGRGGDQVLVKDEDKYHFFGGKSGEVSHNAKIRARVKADALEGLIADASEVLVMGHKIPDFDSFGAAVGMCRIAKSSGKNVFIVLDNVSKGIQTAYETLKESDEHKNLFMESQAALEILNEKTLVIVVDTYRPSLVESKEVLEKAKKIVVFDHHRKSAEFIENAVLTYHEPYASSTSELVTEVIHHLEEKVKLKAVEADALLCGIILDTKSFAIKAGPITFESAAYLRRNGADLVRVKQFFRNGYDDFRIKAAIVSNAEIYKGGVIIATCSFNEEGISVVCAQAADELLEIIDVKASVVISKMYDKIYVSSRSYGDLNVQVLMEKIGGGGHQTVAGAQLDNITIEAAEEKIKQAVDEYLEEDK